MLGWVKFHKFNRRRGGEAAGSGSINLMPEVVDCPGGHDGMPDRRVQQFLQQVFVLDVVLLMQPEGLEQVVGLGLVVAILRRQPGTNADDLSALKG